MDAKECRRRIEKCFPQIQIRSCQPNDEGWDYFVLEVNAEFIFRFPRRPDQEIFLEREIALLPELAKPLSVRVPQFEFISKDDGDCARFVGYRKIEGVPLTRDYLRSTPLRHLARQLARLLSELHRFPVQEAARLKVPYANPLHWHQEFRALYEQVRAKVFPLLDTPLRAKAAALWEDFLNEETCFRFKPVLLHRDLSGGHILCDPSEDRVIGIIDWGDLSIGDPAYDFTGLVRVYGPGFADQVLIDYQGEVDETFRQRLNFYSRKVPFHKILYGLNMNDGIRLELGLAQLQAELG